MGHPDNRLTQLDMLAVEAAKSSNKVTERAVLYDSLGSTPKSGVSSKKGAGSLVGALDTTTEKGRVQSKAVRSATSGPLQLRSAWESPWGKYEKIYDVELGGPVEVAVRKAPPVELVHVRAFAIQATAKTLHLFRQLQHRNIVTALEAFTTDSSLYIVLEHMPLSLELTQLIDSDPLGLRARGRLWGREAIGLNGPSTLAHLSGRGAIGPVGRDVRHSHVLSSFLVVRLR
jgi:hypothetical protein